jgi:GNAT superfamily N-acetyltransferase
MGTINISSICRIKMDSNDIIDQFREFIPFCAKHLGLKQLPEIKWFTNGDPQTEQPTFGSFNKDGNTIRVGISNRHPMDIMRTLAHEMVHYKQSLEGKITDRSGATGSPIENEANATAGIIMRDWGRQHPDMFKQEPITEDDSSPAVIKLRGFARGPDDKGYDPVARARRWIDKITSRMSKNPLNPDQHAMLFKVGGEDALAMFELVPSRIKPGATEIKWFAAHPTGSGIGKQAMQKLQSWATEDNMPLTLYPWDHGEMSQSKLTSFYKSLGFNPIKGHKDMLWEPVHDLNEDRRSDIIQQARDAIDLIKSRLPDVFAIMPQKTIRGRKLIIRVFVSTRIDRVQLNKIDDVITSLDRIYDDLDLRLIRTSVAQRKDLTEKNPGYLINYYRDPKTLTGYAVLDGIMPDGVLVLSTHFKDRVGERVLDYGWLVDTIKTAARKFKDTIASLGPSSFIVKDQYASMAINKNLQPDDSYAYNVSTTRSSLRIARGQPILDVNKDRPTVMRENIAESVMDSIDRIMVDFRRHDKGSRELKYIDSAVTQIIYSCNRERDLVDRNRDVLVNAINEYKFDIVHYMLSLLAKAPDRYAAEVIVGPAVRAFKSLGIDWTELDVIKRSIEADRPKELDEGKLTHKDPVERWISVFKNSTHPMFKGKTPEQRERMARAAQLKAVQNKKIGEGKLLDKPTPTVASLAKKHGVDEEVVKRQLIRGIRVEKEHTNKADVAREIALDHLGEDLWYYKKLAKVEKVDESAMTHINQEGQGGSLEAYVVDTDQPQLMNYLTGQGAKPQLVMKLAEKFKRIAIIRSMWVDEDARGQGTGSSMLESAIDAAFANGAEAIILVADMGEDNTALGKPLDQWYEGWGFRRIGMAGTDPVMILTQGLQEAWSKKYKQSIDCSRPKGFSQRAHCAGRKARSAGKKTKSGSVSEGAKIQAHRQGDTIWLDYFEVSQRGQGLGTKEYLNWEKNLPAEIKKIRLHASDAGHGKSHGFWDKMGFDYEFPDDDNYMIKSINEMNENFADGKGPGKPGDSARHGIPKGATIAQLEKHAKRPGRAGQLARWQLNMRRGKAKK